MSKKTKATDPARFAGNGISYRAKIIGIEDVTEARGDKICQETIQKLKGTMKASGQHKQRIFINVTLEGLKITDGASMSILHTHPVHQISFISRDITDSRAFGYIFGPGDGSHKFFGIKTANAAENLVLALRDLFQTVYEMKKQEMEEAKAKAEAGTGQTETEGQAETEGQTEGQTEDSKNTEGPVTTGSQAGEDGEDIYKVPKNNAPVDPQKQEEDVDNLLVLEDQVDTILKGIEQIKTLEFDELTEDTTLKPPSSSSTTTTTTSATPDADPWGLSAATATSDAPAPASSSALSDLAQLSSPPPTSNPFGTMQAFPGAPAPSMGITAPGFGMTQPGMGQPFGHPGQQMAAGPPMGMPMTRDPFNDSFNTSQIQQRMQAPQVMASQAGDPFGAPFGQPSGFGSPFSTAMSGPSPGQPFPGAMTMAGAPGMQPAFGRASPAFASFGGAPPVAGVGMQMAPPLVQGGGDPFQVPADNPMQPLKPAGSVEARPVSPGRAALFEDLLDMKKSVGVESASKTPKEIFQDLTYIPKKSLNDLKAGNPAAGAPVPTPQASVVFDQDPFTEDPFGSLDTVLNTIASSDVDPFETHHTPPPSSSPPPLPPPTLAPPPPAPPDPSTAHPDRTLSAPSSKESSPEAHFEVPDEPPPPLPSHLILGATAPSPPLRPPPIPNRPIPRPQKTSSSSIKSTSSSVASPPPLPTSPRPSSSTAAPMLASNSSAASSVESVRKRQGGTGDTSAHSSPCVGRTPASSSPSHSWGSSSSLSHSSSQKSLEVTPALAENDDPFGVPLRSKKSFSSADGASKRSSRSSGKSSRKSDPSKAPVTVDPFSTSLTDRTTSSSEGTSVRTDLTTADNPFSESPFSNSVSVASSRGAWEAFGDHAANGVTDAKQTVAVSASGQRVNNSPF